MHDDYYQMNRYQEEAWETAIYPNQGDNLYYPALGLAGEAGEVCNKIKSLTEDYLSLDKENKDNIEVKNILYKDLNTLLSMDK